MRKRKAGSDCLGQRMATALASLTHEPCIAMTTRVDRNHVLGVATRVGSHAQQAVDGKHRFPDSLIVLRVGEFYECFGVDALIVMDILKATPQKNDFAYKFHIGTVQSVLNQLVFSGWDVAMYEETKVLVSPRYRVFTQLVCKSDPLYVRRGGGVATEWGDETSAVSAPDAVPIIALAAAGNASWTVALCYVSTRTVRVYSQVGQSVAEALIERASPPLLCIRDVPKFAKNIATSTLVLGSNAAIAVEDRLISFVAASHAVPETDFHVQWSPATEQEGSMGHLTCVPLSRFSLIPLGIGDGMMNTPSLAVACLTQGAAAPLHHQMIRWLSHPPSYAHALNGVVAWLHTSRSTSIPDIKATRPGRWRVAVAPDVSRPEDLGHMYINVTAHSALCTQRIASSQILFDAIAHDANMNPNALKIETVLDILDAFVTRHGLRRELYAAEEAECERSKTLRLEALSHLTTGSWRIDGNTTSLYGRVDASPERLVVHDKHGRIAADRYTMSIYQHMDDHVASAEDALAKRCNNLMAEVLQRIAPYHSELFVIETWALAMATLVDHVRHVGGKWTIPTKSSDASFRCQGLVPYWMPTAQRNSVDIQPGSPVVLTGPNGGGKSTLLRSLAATALLAQCGLMVPCQHAAVPEYTHIFLRIGAADVVTERRSAFTSEMVDMCTMLRADRGALVLLDEPCRGTSTHEGLRLLEAILEYIPPLTTSVITTHYHELKAPTCEWMQMTATVDRVTAQCRPEFRLQPGRCTESLALRVAVAAGLPFEIVNAARSQDDVKTLVLCVLRHMELEWLELSSHHDNPPPDYRSVLYILVMSSGAVYVGESDRIDARLARHRQSRDVRGIFVLNMKNKTDARTTETRLQQELKYHNVILESITDSSHELR